MPTRWSPRRLLATVVAVGLAAAGLVVVGVPVIRTVERMGVDRARLAMLPIAATTGTGQDDVADELVRSEPVRTAPFTMFGVEVSDPTVEEVRVRFHGDGGWGDWETLDIERDDGPDRASPEYRGGTVTEPIWVGRADGYQIETSGTGIDEVTALAVRVTGRERVVETSTPVAGASPFGRPPIVSRAEWGARPPSSSPSYGSELKLAVVHHSATANGYTRAQVPSIIRSIQAFHMDGRGWSDIAYNFVVDPWGGIWEGRAGGVDELVTGAHAMGFNTNTVGIVGLGTFESTSPTPAMLDAYSEIIAWKFAGAGIDPNGTVAFTSGGSTTIPAGTTVTLPRVIGHRQVGATACPGNQVFAQLPTIRQLVALKIPGKSNPGGVLESITPGPGSFRISGWVADPDTTGGVEMHLYINGAGRYLGTATDPRPDLAPALRSLGINHGFARTITGVPNGTHRVCLYAINVGAGTTNPEIGCRSITVGGNPFGSLDAVQFVGNASIAVSGWAIDPDTTDPIDVHLYVGSRGFNLGRAGGSRPDVGAAFPLLGANHGFSASLGDIPPGTHRVCAYGINVADGTTNPELGCRTVTVPRREPVGELESARPLPDGRVAVRGWAADSDSPAPVEVHLYVGARGFNLGAASLSRPDVARATPWAGTSRDFAATVSDIPGGPQRVCAYGINVGAGRFNPELGCQSVTLGGNPFGSLDIAGSYGPGRVRVAGWAIDPDTAGPVDVHVYVGPYGFNLGPVSLPRPDVGAVHRDFGSDHGFDTILEGIPSGPYQVCAYAINRGYGNVNSSLGCARFVVP
jgi:hypothetical protein